MLARSIVSSIISSLLYIGAITVMLIASQVCSAILILVGITTVIAPICIMKLGFSKPIHVMSSNIIIAMAVIYPLVQLLDYQGVIVPSLAVFSTIISYIAYYEM